MEDSYLTQPRLVEMLEQGGKYESFALDDIHLYSIRDILGNGISFAASKFYESRAYCRVLQRPGRAGPEGGKRLLDGAGPVRCIGGQNWCLPNLVLARISSLNWWPESVARINGF